MLTFLLSEFKQWLISVDNSSQGLLLHFLHILYDVDSSFVLYRYLLMCVELIYVCMSVVITSPR